MNQNVDDAFSVINSIEPPQPLQLKELDLKTRTGIFNAIWISYEGLDSYHHIREIQEADIIYWTDYLDNVITDFEYYHACQETLQFYQNGSCYILNDIKISILGYEKDSAGHSKPKLSINEVFYLIKFLIDTFSKVFHINISNKSNNFVHQLIERLNRVFKSHNVGYRILAKTGLFAPSTNEVESKSIEYSTATPFSETNKHINKALERYGNKEYSDAVDQSIKAVESMCKEIVGDNKATLSGAIKKMKQELPDKTHQALFESIDKLYGYASDTVRHAKIDNKSEPTESEARFVLMTCSSIINYLVALNINNQSK